MIYLDHAAATPLDKEVLKKMIPYLKGKYGNPSSIYALGRETRAAVEDARRVIANILDCKAKEVIFTGGGTESNNWAIFGIAEAYRPKGNHVITTKVEHNSILHPFEQLELRGFDVTYLPTNKYGQIEPGDLQKAITPKTTFASIIYANNEIGTIQRMKEISGILKKRKVVFHTDACQASGQLTLNVENLGVDTMTINAGKVYGPKGVGALYIRSGTKIVPLLHGGGQEFRLRSGTENVAGIVGFAEALQQAETRRPKEAKRLTALRDEAVHYLKAIRGVHLNGHPTGRLPNNINVSIEGADGESLLMRLDMEGIAASSGSACSSGSMDPSHVLKALGLNKELVKNSLRLTLGRENTKSELKKALKIIKELISRLREVG